MKLAVTLVLLLFPQLGYCQACSNQDKVLFYGGWGPGCGTSIDVITNVYNYGIDFILDTNTWVPLVSSDFDEYRAIFFCDGGNENSFSNAVLNADEWSSIIDGNIVIIGTDDQAHSNTNGPAEPLVENGAEFVLDDTCDKTGLYVSLGNTYIQSGSNEATVDLLKEFGTFTVREYTNDCDEVHIVNSHVIVDGITDDDLSNWFCSVHETFLEYPNEFTPIAILVDAGSNDNTFETFDDGSIGQPYILVRGGDIEPIGCSIISCDNSPCKCSELPHCDICHVNGCSQCESGYFKKHYDYPCVHCQEFYGEECLFCQDFNGCGQCMNGCQRVYNSDCQLWECQC